MAMMKEVTMARQRRSPEQIIRLLKQADVLASQGKTVEMICREISVSDATYYKWRKEYGGMGMDQARRLKELETENKRLKRAVADLTLDNQILKEVNEGNF
jgi:transposase-like protein